MTLSPVDLVIPRSVRIVIVVLTVGGWALMPSMPAAAATAPSASDWPLGDHPNRV